MNIRDGHFRYAQPNPWRQSPDHLVSKGTHSAFKIPRKGTPVAARQSPSAAAGAMISIASAFRPGASR